ncbi:MAG: hypothetical protein NC828_01555 [Candidatus Omnitrophica bacterium]|nr:hypothetical protein [Candidatus Omnitrophota bacterium]
MIRQTGLLYKYATELVPFGGIIFHGLSVISPEGKGILICGKSGAGKSTLANRLASKGYGIIDDEISAVLPTTKNSYNIITLPLLNKRRTIGSVKNIPFSTIAVLKHAVRDVSKYCPISLILSINSIVTNIWYFPILVRQYPYFMRNVLSLIAFIPIGVLYHSLQDDSIFDVIRYMTERGGYYGSQKDYTWKT